MTAAPGLPDGSTVRLARRTRVIDDGRVLVGGAPTRVARLVPAAAGLLRGRDLRVSDPTSRRLAEHLLSAGLAEPVVGSLPALPLDGVTVVIPVKDRPEPLSRLLASLPDGLGGVIVVDDGSEDAEGIAAAARAYGVDLVRLEVNAGPAVARNTGLARVRTEFVAFIDSDVVVEPDAIGLLLRHFADPRLALAAPRVLSTAVAAPIWITHYEDARSSLDLGGDAASVRPRSPVTWVSSTALVGRVAALGMGFDPSMRVGEDVDIVWRLVEDGWRVRFEPAAVVRHEPRSTTGTWLGRKRFYGTGAHPLGQRHPEDIAPAVLPWWGVALLILAALQRRWAAAAAALVVAGVVVRITRKLGHVRRPWLLSLRLTGTSLVATGTQGIALLVRHWWPAAVAAALFSRRARRLLAIAAVVDSVWEFLRLRPRLDPVRFAVARRLDDLAYGWGVWEGALRGRSIRALLPAITSSADADRSRRRAPRRVVQDQPAPRP
ncbi:mycofactocin biosynthesis glycosyltransferase MftF [Microbacterium caowuchunii]|uniref:Mycofactocin system glycosyltransferase n=1 Tax=Microbacterium caowuchunii TaxID=2614638 RepID=A0A5N0TEW9_9MICO|nr:mycofactocin biosynthesis glycosyltransferase MftF [Microbacterium caowuchunii]KAA9133683.1 mycofactocin system glycosyltransferase [Microbacterium caowuchunii]